MVMETREWRWIDKSGWGSGPWNDEPDKMQWTDANTGLPCLVVRQGRGGYLCGYVGVTSDHRAFGKDWNDDYVGDLDVHGGVTFGDKCRPGGSEHGICHIPGPGEPEDVWWIGFDCAHHRDHSPVAVWRDPQWRAWVLAFSGDFADETDGEYRTFDYVRGECASLARQLAEGW